MASAQLIQFFRKRRKTGLVGCRGVDAEPGALCRHAMHNHNRTPVAVRRDLQAVLSRPGVYCLEKDFVGAEHVARCLAFTRSSNAVSMPVMNQVCSSRPTISRSFSCGPGPPCLHQPTLFLPPDSSPARRRCRVCHAHTVLSASKGDLTLVPVLFSIRAAFVSKSAILTSQCPSYQWIMVWHRASRWNVQPKRLRRPARRGHVSARAQRRNDCFLAQRRSECGRVRGVRTA
jgi:hypothetical protein